MRRHQAPDANPLALLAFGAALRAEQRDHGSLRVEVARTRVFEVGPVLLANVEIKVPRISAGAAVILHDPGSRFHTGADCGIDVRAAAKHSHACAA